MAGIPQGSVLGQLLWNVEYNAVFHIPLPPSTRIVYYADNMLVMVEGTSAEEAGSRVNVALSTVAGWIQQERSGHSLALDKTETVLFTRKYKFTPPWLTVSGVEILLKDSITYLGFGIDKHLRFRPYVDRAAHRDQRMPNLGKPWEVWRRFLVNVMHSVLLYGFSV